MRKLISIVLAFIVTFSLPATVFAQKSNEVSTLQNLYDSAYTLGLTSNQATIENDYSAYAFLLNNFGAARLENNQIILLNQTIPDRQLIVLQNFIHRLNVLLNNSVIEIDNKWKITVKDAPLARDTIRARATIIDIMPETRKHARQLREVFDNAVFGTAHITAGLYFSERVKSGGIWDYKSYLGTNTRYYEMELRSNMTGETIGNFHYGYVGHSVFGSDTLKRAAGLIQIISGTSDFSFWNSYFDDPRDTEDIQWGIDVYNQEH